MCAEVKLISAISVPHNHNVIVQPRSATDLREGGDRAQPRPAVGDEIVSAAICNQPALPDEESGRAPRDEFEAALAPLWARAQAGDETAYRDALLVIAARLRVYFARRLRALPDEVEDLVQETLLALHLKRATHDPALPVSNWVFAIAGYKLVDLWRRRGRREALHEPFDELAEAKHPAMREDLLARRDIEALLGTLPAAQSAAITLLKIEGLTAVEASKRSGISVSALKVQVHRGLRRLAELVRKPE